MTSVDLGLILLIAPFVVGVVEALKRAGLPARLAPVAAIVAGLLIVGVATNSTDSRAILAGIGAGLSAAGLYSGVKKTASG